jgi:hypothetical protein
MKMQQNILTWFRSLPFVMLGLITLPAFSQTEYERVGEEEQYFEPTSTQPLLFKNDSSLNQAQLQPSFNLTLGSTFMVNNTGNTGMLNYIAPSYIFPVNERFTASFGAIIYQGDAFINNMGMGMENWANYNLGMPSQGALFFASGSYQLNNRAVVSGMFFADANQIGGALGQQGVRGGAVDFHYKIGNNTSISFGVSMQQGGNAFTPFGMPGGGFMQPGMRGGSMFNQPFLPGF